MIKNFRQFNEELSPELLSRASSAAQQRGQEARTNKFYYASVEAKSKEREARYQENKNQFMELTKGKLFGIDCEIDRVNPRGDTWIKVPGKFKTVGGKIINNVYVTDQSITGGFVVTEEDKPVLPLSELVLTRGDAMRYNKFSNWWMGEDKPFSVDDYCISGIHVD
jgi:hypothetical protein